MEQQEKGKINLAIISPSKEASSETFIAAHRHFLPYTIHYYHGGNIPKFYENVNLATSSILNRGLYVLRRKFLKKSDNVLIDNLKISLRKNNIQVVLAEYGPVGAAMCGICKELHLPLVVHFFGFDVAVFDVLQKYSDSYLKLFNYATKVISVSNPMTRKLISLGCMSDKIFYNPCGPHEDFLKTPTPEFRSNTFISIVRFVDKKAPYYVIFAFEKVLKKFPDVNLILGGDGPLLNVCKNIVRYLGIESKVHFAGFLERQSYIDYFKTSLCYVQHSITADNGDMEGTPVAILEASAAGLPIVSTRHGGISDVVVEGETGFLVDEHDVHGMADKMIYLLKDKNSARQMGLNGRENVRTNFSMAKHIENLKNIIDDAYLNNRYNG
jgi:glycosyltransferase involved in cell wall biosynthesis